jgi:serine/threonine-protein kinase
LAILEPTPFGDKYILVEHIATGGMAEIYRANYAGIEGFAKELVVKRLRPEFGARPDVVGMFLDEARVAATLTHNNVVHTYDLGEIGGEYFIAMELLKGRELVEVLRSTAKAGRMIPPEIAIGIIMQGLEGLHYVHARTDDSGEPLGLVHRDINPTNIHVGYDGLCKVVDFGIAATRAQAMAAAGTPAAFAGKLAYMAPEQVLGEDVDHRADLFAMGVMLWEMLLGRRLFRGPAEDVRRRILEGDIPAPTFVDPDFPPALEGVIMKSLEADPAARHQNADHMFRDLEAYLSDAGLSWTQRRISAYMAELFGEGAPANVAYEDEYADLDDDLGFDRFDPLSRFDRPAGEGDAAPDWVRQIEQRGGKGDSASAKSGAGARRSLTLGSIEALVQDASVTGPRPVVAAPPVAAADSGSRAMSGAATASRGARAGAGAVSPTRPADGAAAPVRPAASGRAEATGPASGGPSGARGSPAGTSPGSGGASTSTSVDAPAKEPASGGRGGGRAGRSGARGIAPTRAVSSVGSPATAGNTGTQPRTRTAVHAPVSDVSSGFGQSVVRESSSRTGLWIGLAVVAILAVLGWLAYSIFTQK